MDDRIDRIIKDWQGYKIGKSNNQCIDKIYDFAEQFLSRGDIVHILNYIENEIDEAYDD